MEYDQLILVVPFPRVGAYALLTSLPLKTPLGCFLSNLHALSMLPTFILCQDQTLHEIQNYITYKFLLHGQS